MQRAIVAMRLGELEEAVVHADAAIARPVGRDERGQARYHVDGALSVRAFAYAALKRPDPARSDIEAARRNPEAATDSLARVALAELLIAAHAGDRAAMRDLLRRDRTLLLENCHPRERALVRALQRMAQVSKAGAYRGRPHHGRAEAPAGDEPGLAEWVGKVAPAAVPFVRSPGAAMSAPAGGYAPEAGPPSWQTALATPFSAEPTRVDTSPPMAIFGRVLRWIGVFLFFPLFAAAVSTLAETPASAHAASMLGLGTSDGALRSALAAMLAAALLVGLLAFRAARRRRAALDHARVRHLGRLAAIGSGALDAASFARLARSASALVAAQARLYESMVEERAVRFDAMYEACEKGLARLGAADADSQGLLLLRQDLLAQRAYALALLDCGSRAEAEVAALASAGYPHRARAELRVRLVRLVRAGRLEDAARWAGAAGSLQVGAREELLADLVRFAASRDDADSDERARLRSELDEPDQRAWIEAVAGSLVRVVS